MTAKLLTIAFAITALQIATPSSFADPPTQGERLKESYHEDRAKELIKLNRRYIDSFQKELDALLAPKKLEEANKIQMHIKALEAEIQALKAERAKAKTTSDAKSTKADATLLIGKTLAYAHHADDGMLYYVSFQKNGKAQWLGNRNQSVPRVYEPTGKPRQFALWSAQRPDFGKTIITVGPKGKTAHVIVHTGKITKGTIERTQ